MTERPALSNIDLHPVRVLHTVITERNVSRAALKLQAAQPRVSAQLKRLRRLTADPLLVRSGAGMVPTEAALAMLKPAARLLEDADRLFDPCRHAHGSDPASCVLGFRIAASDHLDPLCLPGLVEVLQRESPGASIHLHPLMVVRSRLVLTTGRQFCSRCLDALPVQILACPVDFPPLSYFKLWHGRAQAAAAQRWLREQVKAVAADLLMPGPARSRARAVA